MHKNHLVNSWLTDLMVVPFQFCWLVIFQLLLSQACFFKSHQFLCFYDFLRLSVSECDRTEELLILCMLSKFFPHSWITGKLHTHKGDTESSVESKSRGTLDNWPSSECTRQSPHKWISRVWKSFGLGVFENKLRPNHWLTTKSWRYKSKS